MAASIDEEALERELLAYIAGGRGTPNNALATMLLDIAKSIRGSRGEEWREDCVQEAAIHLCTKVVQVWEPTPGTRPLSYFYTCADNAAIKEYREQQRQRKGDTTAFHLYDGREGEVSGIESLQDAAHHLFRQKQRKADVRRWGDRADEMRAKKDAEKEAAERREDEREEKRETVLRQREEETQRALRVRREKKGRAEQERVAKEKRKKHIEDLVERGIVPPAKGASQNFRMGDLFRARRSLCRKLRYVVEIKRKAHFVYPYTRVARGRVVKGKHSSYLLGMYDKKIRERFGIPHFSEIRLEGEEKVKETGVSLKCGENS